MMMPNEMPLVSDDVDRVSDLETSIAQQKEENLKLIRELSRLHEEKVTMTEVFSDTIARYEHEISELEVDIIYIYYLLFVLSVRE